MDIRNEIITGTFAIGHDGRKEPIDWKDYALKLEEKLAASNWPLQCSLDEQQCRDSCEDKEDRSKCPFVSKLPYQKEFHNYFKKYYPHLIPANNEK